MNSIFEMTDLNFFRFVKNLCAGRGLTDGMVPFDKASPFTAKQSTGLYTRESVATACATPGVVPVVHRTNNNNLLNINSNIDEHGENRKGKTMGKLASIYVNGYSFEADIYGAPTKVLVIGQISLKPVPRLFVRLLENAFGIPTETGRRLTLELKNDKWRISEHQFYLGPREL